MCTDESKFEETHKLVLRAMSVSVQLCKVQLKRTFDLNPSGEQQREFLFQPTFTQGDLDVCFFAIE